MFGGEVIWVHWLDINNRTAAMGNPDGGGFGLWTVAENPATDCALREKYLIGTDMICAA